MKTAVSVLRGGRERVGKNMQVVLVERVGATIGGTGNNRGGLATLSFLALAFGAGAAQLVVVAIFFVNEHVLIGAARDPFIPILKSFQCKRGDSSVANEQEQRGRGRVRRGRCRGRTRCPACPDYDDTGENKCRIAEDGSHRAVGLAISSD